MGSFAEHGILYCNILIGANIEGFRHIVVMVSHCGRKLATKYFWCQIGAQIKSFVNEQLNNPFNILVHTCSIIMSAFESQTPQK